MLNKFGPPAFWALAWSMAVLWSRWASLLTGDAFFSSFIVLGSLLAGLMAGHRVGRRPVRSNSARSAAAGFGIVVLGVITANAVRFLGMTLSDAAYLLGPLLSVKDVFFIYGQLAVLLFPSGVFLGILLSSESKPRAVRFGLAPVLSFAAPVLFLWIGRRFGGVIDFELFYAVVLLGGVGQLARDRSLRRDPAWRVGGAVVFFIFLFGGMKAAHLWSDIFSHRLNSMAPGSQVAYQWRFRGKLFSLVHGVNRQDLLFQDGVLSRAHEAEAKAVVALAKAAAPGAGKALMFGVIDGGMIDAGLRLGMAIEIADENLRAVEAQGITSSYSSAVRLSESRWIRRLKTGDERFDVIVFDYGRPLDSLADASRLNTSILANAKARLSDGGAVAIWLPLPAFPRDLGRAAATLRAAGLAVSAWSYPGGAGILLIGTLRSVPWDRLGADLQANLEKINSDLPPARVLEQVKDWTAWAERESAARRPLRRPGSFLAVPAVQFLLGRRMAMISEEVLSAK